MDDGLYNEYLTDMAVIAFGFGIFQGNSQWTHTNYTKFYTIGKSGYIPREMIGYAMALIESRRGSHEYPDYLKYLNPQMRHIFKNSFDFILQEKSKNHKPNLRIVPKHTKDDGKFLGGEQKSDS